MAVPVIQTHQSVLGYLQGQFWAFQPFAFNGPTSWVASPLPPGMSFDTLTGRISGAATTAGIYVVALQAINGSGTSTAQVFTIAIEPASDISNSPELAIYIDLDTRGVSRSIDGDFGGAGKADPPLLTLKHGDDLLLRVQFTRRGTVQDMPVAGLRLVLKEFEADSPLIEATTWRKTSFSPPAWKIHAALTGDGFAGVLGSYENENEGAHFAALAEVEWIADAPDTPFVGAAQLRSSSASFRVDCFRDLATPDS